MTWHPNISFPKDPVVQYGPFVMTTKDEIYQAFSDYQSHANGFENAAYWKSKIGK
jgi:hypothetical protein